MDCRKYPCCEKERRLFLDKRRERIYNKGKDIVGKDMDDGTV
jgi:hypothetical protein